MAKTDWQMGDIVQPADMNQIGQEINDVTEGLVTHKTASVLDHPDGSVTSSKLADNAVTDAKIGNRTADPTQVPANNGPGTLTQWLSWIANRIKTILGTANWYDLPPTTLSLANAHINATTGVHGATSAATPNSVVQRDSAGRAKVAAPAAADDIARKDTVDAVQTNLTNHIADYVRQPGYAVATGSANAYSVTLNPAPSTYVDGMGVTVKINVDNTGPATVNVNGLGAKAIKRANGLDVAAGMLKAGSIVTLRYNTTTGNFILQGEGSDVIPLYIAGVEYVSWVTGYSYGSPTLSKESDHLRIRTDSTNEQGTWVTNYPVDLTNISYIAVQSFETLTVWGNASIVVSTEKNGDIHNFTKKTDASTSSTIIDHSSMRVLNVSDLSGPYYIRIHRQQGNSDQLTDFRIYRIIAIP